jgi:hypothetical protein
MDGVDDWLEFEDDAHKRRYQIELEMENETYFDDENDDDPDIEDTPRKRSSYLSRKKTTPRKHLFLQKLLGKTEEEGENNENKPETLTGIHTLPALFAKEQTKTKRVWGCPGNEHQDVADMIWMYARWFRSVLPSMSFDNAIDFAESSSFSTEVKDELKIGRKRYAPEEEKDERDTAGTSTNTVEKPEEEPTEEAPKKKRPIRKRRRFSKPIDESDKEQSDVESEKEDEQDNTQPKQIVLEDDEPKEKQVSPPRKRRRLKKKAADSDSEDDEM